jgi:hypothetical protein
MVLGRNHGPDHLDGPACQISFGVVGGYVVFKSAKVETMQTWPIAARMGVHAMESEKDV